ncbi:MAG: 2-C-methyl-D-erythritol 4-phosphate cytidylyltransferase [Bacteroidia bacterium]|nr:2-C-methyl-D-erythritol 4-phosphate cytidylyltransferase [Bacteroidia bacterium]
MEKYIIIVAGGNGSRMNNSTPKQFIQLDGKPILLHTIEKFIATIPNIHIVLVLAKNYQEQWNSICKTFKFNYPILLTEGGETRFHSVKNGLSLVPDNCIVGIHDAARPLVSDTTITEAFSLAEIQGNASPAISISESLREINEEGNKAVNRNNFLIIQTPQCFQSSTLKKAFLQTYHPSFTDDASVLEAMGEKIHLTTGNKENIKITTPEDLMIAEMYLKLNK